MKRKGLRGLTILEVMITIFIFSLIIAAIFGIMTQSRLSFYIGNTKIEVQQEIRKAITVMNKELRQTTTSKIVGVPVDGNYYNTITFKIPQDRDGDGDVIDSFGNIEWSDEISYSLINGQIIRNATDGNPPILANNIIRLLFRRRNPKILEITVEAKKKALIGPESSANLTTQVTLRN